MLVDIINHIAAVTPLWRASQDAGIWFLMLDQQKVTNMMDFLPTHKENK